ncbi:hypothetical protein V6615_09755 [Oscillospiraceae bacterium PP1C4]
MIMSSQHCKTKRLNDLRSAFYMDMKKILRMSSALDVTLPAPRGTQTAHEPPAPERNPSCPARCARHKSGCRRTPRAAQFADGGGNYEQAHGGSRGRTPLRSFGIFSNVRKDTRGRVETRK